MDKNLIDEGKVKKIKERGCCLGEYRVLFDDVFYCSLEDASLSNEKERNYIREEKDHMFCSHQRPCKQCNTYKKSGTKADKN